MNISHSSANSRNQGCNVNLYFVQTNRRAREAGEDIAQQCIDQFSLMYWICIEMQKKRAHNFFYISDCNEVFTVHVKICFTAVM